MKILYYIPELTEYNGGIFQYACALLKILGQDANNQYYVLHNSADPVVLEIISSSPNLTLIPAKVGGEKRTEKAISFTFRNLQLFAAKRGVELPLPLYTRVERLCNKYEIDVVYCPYQDIPRTTRKTISTLHDVQEIHFPEFFTSGERLHRAALHKEIADKSSLIIVSYKHIKKDLITYFQRSEENVLVCLLSMENLWFDKLSAQSLTDIQSLNLPGEFIFYPAATWPHKNHIGLLKAIASLKVEKNLLVNAVFTGHQNSHYAAIKKEVNRLNITEQVHFIGVVNENVLFSIYHAAKAVVVPTLYEAGSFPLMESMMMNIPVVCSNVTSLPDTIGNEDFVFNPSNFQEMADKVERILTDEDFINQNKKNSIEQARKLRNTGALAILQKALATLK